MSLGLEGEEGMSVEWGLCPKGRRVQGVQTPNIRAVTWSAVWSQAVTCHLSVLTLSFWEESWVFTGVWPV